MDDITNLKLAELRQQELRAVAAHARRRTGARRASYHRTFIDWLRAHPRSSALVAQRIRPADAMLSMARPIPFAGLASELAANGPTATHDKLVRFVEFAAARGASRLLLSVLADDRRRTTPPDLGAQTSRWRGSAVSLDPGSEHIPHR